METLEAHNTDNVLEQCHGQRHDDKHDGIIPEGAGEGTEQIVIQFGKDKQQHRAEPVERQARAEQKAGVQPLALRVGPGEEPAEQKLQHPSADTAEEEQIQNDQEDLEFGHNDLREP